MEKFYNEKLNKRIENLVVKNVNYKRRIDPDTYDQYYEKSVPFARYVESKFTEDEYEYVFEYLKDKDILVYGEPDIILSDFENYRSISHKEIVSAQKLDNGINKEENQKLIIEYSKETDIEKKNQIRNKIALKNMKFLLWIVRAIEYTTGVENSEIIGAGYEGLIYAIERYDVSKGSFPEYIKRTISGFILSSMYEYYDFESRGTFCEVNKYKRNIEKSLGKKNLSFQEISDEILDSYINDNPHRKEIDLIEKFTFNVSDSFDSNEIVDDNNEIDDVIEHEFQRNMKDDLKQAMEELSDDYKNIVIDLYGISTGKTMSYREASAKYGLTHQGIAYKKNKAIAILSKNKKLQSYRHNFKK